MQKYEDLEPKKVFYWFKQLNDIPRGSGNEKAVSDFLVWCGSHRGKSVIAGLLLCGKFYRLYFGAAARSVCQRSAAAMMAALTAAPMERLL